MLEHVAAHDAIECAEVVERHLLQVADDDPVELLPRARRLVLRVRDAGPRGHGLASPRAEIAVSAAHVTHALAVGRDAPPDRFVDRTVLERRTHRPPHLALGRGLS